MTLTRLNERPVITTADGTDTINALWPRPGTPSGPPASPATPPGVLGEDVTRLSLLKRGNLNVLGRCECAHSGRQNCRRQFH